MIFMYTAKPPVMVLVNITWGEKSRMSWFSAEHCQTSLDAPVKGLADTGRPGWADFAYP
jgi:hypothetical protein